MSKRTSGNTGHVSGEQKGPGLAARVLAGNLGHPAELGKKLVIGESIATPRAASRGPGRGVRTR